MMQRAISDFLSAQRLKTQRQVLFNSRIVMVANLILMYPDTLVLGPAVKAVRIIRTIFIFSLLLHSITIAKYRRHSIVDGIIFMVLTEIGTVAISLAVGSSETRYIFSLALIFLWCATSVPTTPRSILVVNVISISVYIAFSVALHDIGDPGSFFFTLFFLLVSTYVSFFMVKTANQQGIEQIYLKQKEEEKAEELNRANIELQKTSEQLQALDQAKSGFFANINRDLRAPLSLVMRHLQSAEEKLSGSFSPYVVEHLNKANFNAIRLYSLVKDILDLTRMDMQRFRLKLSRVDLAVMVQGTVADVAELARKKPVSVVLSPLPTTNLDYLVQADHGQIDRVLINLLTNAVETTPPGGNVTVSIMTSDDNVGFLVRDSGPGIAADVLPNIFSRGFYNLERKASDSSSSTDLGLGLDLAKTIVNAHQGRIEAFSVEGHGMEFRVSLRREVVLAPQSVEQRQRPQTVLHERRKPHPEDSLDTIYDEASRLSRMQQIVTAGEQENILSKASSSSILIVDDNKETADMLGDILATYRTSYALNGVEGLALARRSRPDLIVTESIMEGGDGLSFLAELRADLHLQNVPVIMVSGTTSLDHKRQVSQQGVDAFFEKPFDVHVVRSTVSRLINRESKYAAALMERSREDLAFFVQGLAHNVLNALNNISGSLTISLQQVEESIGGAQKRDDKTSLLEAQENYSEGMASITRVHESVLTLQRCVDDAEGKSPEVELVRDLVNRSLLAVGGKETVSVRAEDSTAGSSCID